MNRMPEVEHFPACHYYGLGIVPYSPLARGVLTGKYTPDAAPDKDTRAEAFQALLEAYLLDKALYELMYELDNRPAWIGIPLRGILTLQA